MKTARGIKILIGVLLGLLSAAIISLVVYLRGQYSRTTYFDQTKINGYDVSGKEPAEVRSILLNAYSTPSVTIKENGEDSIRGTLSDYGYTIDEKALGSELNEALDRQKSSVLILMESLIAGNTFEVKIPFSFDEDKFNAQVCAASMKEARVSSTDAELKFNEKESIYYIEPETYGNEFDDSQFQSLVKEKIDLLVSADRPAEDLTIDFPTDIYIKPEVTSDDAELNSQMNMYNQYSKAKITYDFGSQTKVLDWSTIKDWLTVTDGVAMIRADKIAEYVDGLAYTYNTRYIDRTFHTSLGTDITIPGDLNTYGYTIDEDSEAAQLLADIQANTATQREPVYYSVTQDGYATPVYFRREGTDDLGGNYVEISLDQQHLWLYRDYGLVIDTPVVTGNVSKGHGTNKGVYPLAYKESPSKLKGQDGPNGYSVEVNYWMPFSDGQGLHDADWRTTFGGQIYQTNGSHGCVNLPPAVAGTIYNNVEAGMAIIVY